MAIKKTDFEKNKTKHPKTPNEGQGNRNPLKWMVNTLGVFAKYYNCNPGEESYREQHSSGFMKTHYPDGSQATLAPGTYTVTGKAGMIINVEENGAVEVSGHGECKVSGGIHLEVKGNANIKTSGGAFIQSDGDIGLDGKNVYIGARGNLNLQTKGQFQLDAAGTSTIISDGDMTLATKAAMNRSAGGRISDKGGPIHHNSSADSDGPTVTNLYRVTAKPSSEFS